MRWIAWCSSFGSVHFLVKSCDALALRLRNVYSPGKLDAGRSRQPEVHKPSDPAERKTPASNPYPCVAGTHQGLAFHRTARGDPLNRIGSVSMSRIHSATPSKNPVPMVLCFRKAISGERDSIQAVPDRTCEQGRRSIHRSDQRNDAC